MFHFFVFVFVCGFFLLKVPVLGFVVAVLVGGCSVVNMASSSSARSSSGGISGAPFSYSQDVCVETANHGMWKVCMYRRWLLGRDFVWGGGCVFFFCVCVLCFCVFVFSIVFF